MKRFFGGAMVAVALIAAVVLVWYGLNDQAKGLVVGVMLGAGGIVVGILVALAVVGVLLLMNLRWSVQAAKPPVILPGIQPALPAPQQQQWSAPRRRSPRAWESFVGVEDVEDFTAT